MSAIQKVLGSVVAAGLATVAFAPSALAATKTGGTTSCTRRCTTDTTPPTVSITSPAAGATVSGTVTVSGAASDNVAVANVAVSVDNGAWQTASGTSSWTWSWNTGSLTNGTHTVAARSTDTSNNLSTVVTQSVTVNNASSTTAGSNGTLSWTNSALVDPAASHPLAPLGWGKQAAWGVVTAVLYNEQFTYRTAAYFRDSTSGASTFVSLPVDTSAGWSNASYVMSSATDLWIESGDGPVYLRHYTFAVSSGLPSSATLVSSQTLGDADSRHGDVTVLASGAVVAVWHQQGANGAPQGQYVAYHSGSGGWQTLGPLQFMATASSKQVVAQQPSDGSVWVFGETDGWGSIGVAHLTETSGSVALDWTNGSYINTARYGNLGPDPENPDVAVVPDPSTGTLALAYEDANRSRFSTTMTGSYVAVDRISASGTMSFIELPVYVEWVGALGLVVQPGATWLAYLPVDPATATASDVYVDAYTNGRWEPAADLGTLAAGWNSIGYGPGRIEFSAALSDGSMHFFTVS